MKNFALYGALAATFCLTQSFVSQPKTEVKMEKSPDWIIKVEASGITVIDDGRTCIDIQVYFNDRVMSWSNCTGAGSPDKP